MLAALTFEGMGLRGISGGREGFHVVVGVDVDEVEVVVDEDEDVSLLDFLDRLLGRNASATDIDGEAGRCEAGRMGVTVNGTPSLARGRFVVVAVEVDDAAPCLARGED
jgi:hypothetical protein